jgi:hypothetical protein
VAWCGFFCSIKNHGVFDVHDFLWELVDFKAGFYVLA